MIAYTMLGTNQLEKAAAFYDALFSEIGVERSWSADKSVAWSASPKTPTFAITLPYDGEAASVGNGTMIALALPNTDAVDRVYNKAIELGATDEGAAGPRGDQFYCGYFRDLDGNKINAFAFIKQ